MSRYHITTVDFRDEASLLVTCTPRTNGGFEVSVGGEVGLMLSEAQVSQVRNVLDAGAAKGWAHVQECGGQS